MSDAEIGIVAAVAMAAMMVIAVVVGNLCARWCDWREHRNK